MIIHKLLISNRIDHTQVPPLVEYGELAAKNNCISLGQGAPIYAPTEFISNTMNNLSENIHRYTGDPGITSLRYALREKLIKDNRITVDENSIVVTSGANQAFINILSTLCDPDDIVILLGPYYFNHKMACEILNVDYIELPLTDDFRIDTTGLNELLTRSDRIKAVVLVNPGNPTGVVHSRDEIVELSTVLDKYNCKLISDETYEYFTYRQKHISSARYIDNCITIHSFSKTFGIPGWRLGYYFSNDHNFINQSIKVQDTIAICAPAPAQYLGVELLNNRDEIIPVFKKFLENNHNISKDMIQEVDWLVDNPSNGAYYLFPEQNTGISSAKLAKILIEQYKIYIVPGDVFGDAGKSHFRISFANVDENTLIDAFDRLKKYRG